MPLIITDVQHNEEDFGLSPEILRLLWQMEEGHFWHRARNEWIARALRNAGVFPPATILEVGCGSGAVAAFLHRLGYRVTGIDTCGALVCKAHERCPEATFIVGDVKALPVQTAFDAIGFFDVLEHLNRPADMIAACQHHAAPRGLVMATVPAQRRLQTVIDDLSGHKRRYEAGELARLFTDAGLFDVQERGIFRAVAPFQRMSRRSASRCDSSKLTSEDVNALWTSNFKIPPMPINVGLELLCMLERVVGFGLGQNRTGASLIATGRWSVATPGR